MSQQHQREWTEKDIYGAMRNLYDEIWVYGIQKKNDPVKNLPYT